MVAYSASAIGENVNFKDFIGKEVYVACGAPESAETFPLCLVRYKSDLRNYLEKFPIDEGDRLIAAFGILTSALSIPLELPVNTEIFLILKDATSEYESYILEVESLEKLQDLISYVTAQDPNEEDIPDDLIDELPSIEPQQIEDIFVLYGEKVELMYSCGIVTSSQQKINVWKYLFKLIEEKQPWVSKGFK